MNTACNTASLPSEDLVLRNVLTGITSQAHCVTTKGTNKKKKSLDEIVSTRLQF